MREIAPPEWHGRYDPRVEDTRLPATPAKREAYAVQVGADGFHLLDAVDAVDAPDVRELPAVGVLRRVWARHVERVEPGSQDEPMGGGGDGATDRVRLRPAHRGAAQATAP